MVAEAGEERAAGSSTSRGCVAQEPLASCVSWGSFDALLHSAPVGSSSRHGRRDRYGRTACLGGARRGACRQREPGHPPALAVRRDGRHGLRRGPSRPCSERRARSAVRAVPRVPRRTQRPTIWRHPRPGRDPAWQPRRLVSGGHAKRRGGPDSSGRRLEIEARERALRTPLSVALVLAGTVRLSHRRP